MGTLKVNGAISATGTISATNGFIGNLDWSYIINEPNFALKRNNSSFYVGLGNCSPGSTTPTYYRIILPDSQLNIYGMYTIDILVHQKYDSGYGGKIVINAYHNTSDMSWYGFSASVSGTLTNDIKVYGSNGKYFYISGCSAWGNLAIENMVVGDAAVYSDLTGTVVDLVTSLPSGYQTATMVYELNSSNYSSYAMPASYWNWNGQSGQPTWLWGGNEFGKWYVYNPANFNVNYASGSDYSYGLAGRGISDNITTVPPTGRLVYDYNVLGRTSGLFPHDNNANSIITLNKHVGNYDSQLGFSSNGRIYYRNFNDGALNTSSGWNTIAFTSDTVAGADTVDGYHASSLFKIGPWWYSESSHNANDLINSTVFAYSHHNIPYTGTVVDFSNSNNTNYRLQINAAYNADHIAFRSRDGDNSTWREWTSFITSANYTSYCAPASHSHSYASLASPNNMIHSGNEYTFVPEGYSGVIWLNYRAGWSTTGNINSYIFGNGKGSMASIEYLYNITHNYGSGTPGSSTPGYGTAGAIYYKV